MKFHLISIFPEIFDSYFSRSIVKRALEKKIIEIKVHNPRDFSRNRHRKVDDTPYGGGPGMVMSVEPVWNCVQSVKKNDEKNGSKKRTILFSAKGKRYSQKDALRLSRFDELILICGRYEGVDERVAEHVSDEEISIGDFVLTGGELPAMVLVDSISRLFPGVLGNPASLENESFSSEEVLEYPQYTKPENFNGWSVPKILLSGNHGEIDKWRKNFSQKKK